MAYTIVFYRDGQKLGSSPWPGDLSTAKTHAASYLNIHKATSVTVFDDDEKAVFSKDAAKSEGDEKAPSEPTEKKGA